MNKRFSFCTEIQFGGILILLYVWATWGKYGQSKNVFNSAWHTWSGEFDRSDRGQWFQVVSVGLFRRRCGADSSSNTDWTFWMVLRLSSHWPPHIREQLSFGYFCRRNLLSCIQVSTPIGAAIGRSLCLAVLLWLLPLCPLFYFVFLVHLARLWESSWIKIRCFVFCSEKKFSSL